MSKFRTQFQNAQGSNIQLDNTIEIWSFIIMLTRKALIVHCVTSPPLRHSARFGRTVAQRKRGTDWRMTLNLHLAKQQIFKQISKMFPRQKGRKCFFVVAFCGVFVVILTTWPEWPGAKWWPAWKSNYFDCIQSPCEDWAVWT